MMDARIDRFKTSTDESATLGRLYIDDKFVCFTLEDKMQRQKVYGQTRIPEGRYRLSLRKAGRLHSQYLNRYGLWHRGMIELVDVPGFTYIYIHKGYDVGDTLGCVLVGMRYRSTPSGGFVLEDSEAAYRKVYQPIADAIEAGQAVSLKVNRFDRGVRRWVLYPLHRSWEVVGVLALGAALWAAWRFWVKK